MKTIARGFLGLGIVAAAAVAFYNVSWAEKPGEACPAMGCPAMKQIHADVPGFIADPSGEPSGEASEDRANPHKSMTPGVCPYSGRTAVSEANQA